MCHKFMASMSWQTVGVMQIFPEALEYWCDGDGSSNGGTKRIKNKDRREKKPMA